MIEQEEDGTWSVYCYCIGHVCGGFATPDEADKASFDHWARMNPEDAAVYGPYVPLAERSAS